MLKLEEWMDIRSLHKEGHSIKAIARMTGRSRNTVRRVLREAGFAGFQKPQRASRLDSYKEYLRNRYEEGALSAVRLLPEIQAMGYTGSIATVRRYLHSLKPEQERLRKLTVRTTTEKIASPEFQEWLVFKNLEGFDIYIGMNTLKLTSYTRTKQDIETIRHLYADLDYDGPRALTAIENSELIPKPNFVLQTSPDKYQVVWKVEGIKPEEAETNGQAAETSL